MEELFMDGYVQDLDQGIFDEDEKVSLDKSSVDNEGKNKGKVLDITQQQWFWDQGVLS